MSQIVTTLPGLRPAIRSCGLPISAAALFFAILQGCSPATGPESAVVTPDAAGVHPEIWPSQTSPFRREPAVEARIAQMLSQMTLEDKVGQIIQADIGSVTPAQVRQFRLGSILNGGNSAPGRDNRAKPEAWLKLADEFYHAATDRSDGRLGIPLMWGTDAVHGHSKIVGSTLFPHNIGLGAANDPELLRRIGEVTAIEMRVTGLDWTFAPTIAVARNDRWGRTYESWSENPELVARYTPKLLEGLQGKVGTEAFLGPNHLLATVKHFVGDGGTVNGMDQGDNLVSEATLRDIHAAGYPAAINAGALAVMASFNSWQGERMHGHKSLLSDVLVGRMGFDGMVVGDWNGHGQVNGCSATSCAAAINAGLDLYMAPDSWQGLYVSTLAQVRSGDIAITRLDEAVARILRVKFRMGLLALDPALAAKAPSQRAYAGNFTLLGSAEHRAVARTAVRKSLVLLKNNQQTLPIKANAHVLVTGDGANNIGKQSGGWTFSWQGTGNSNAHFPNGESIFDGLKKALELGKGSAELSLDGSFAQRPDLAIVVFGEDPYAEFQGDRPQLDFDDDRGLLLLAKLKQQGIRTVSIFLSGRPLWVNPELNQSDAFVAAWLPGSEGGGIADVLVQRPEGGVNVDFQGQLSFSWPDDATGNELNVGDADYRPLFAYGYGLRYDSSKDIAALHEKSGLNASLSTNYKHYFNAGKTMTPWRLQLIDQGTINDIENAVTVSGHRAITVTATDTKKSEDALTLDFQAKAVVAIAQANDAAIDLKREMNGDMAIEIRYQVIQQDAESVRIGMACGAACGNTIEFADALKKQVGKGWLTRQILLSCFQSTPGQRELDFGHITAPWFLSADGGLKLQVASLNITSNEGAASCNL